MADPRVIAVAQGRTILIGAVGIVAYYALLYFVPPALPLVPVPSWWRGIWNFPGAAVQSWFGVVGMIAALSAALPVAALLAWRIRHRAVAVGLAIGVLVAACILVSGIIEYGTRSRTVIAAVIQFLCVGLALPAMTMLLVRVRDMRD